MAKPTKKPNSFSKGMMSDIDANALPADSYKEAINGRLLTRDDNSFVLKNAKGNTEFTTLQEITKTISFSDASTLSSANIVGLTNPQLLGWKIIITGDDGFTPVVVEAKQGIIFAGVSWGVGYGYDQDVDSNTMMTIGLSVALQNSSVADKLNINGSVGINSVYTISYSDRLSENMTIEISPFVFQGSGESITFQYYVYTGVLGSPVTNTYEVVGVAEFSNYAAVIAKSNAGGLDAIFKITPSADFSTSTVRTILRTDLGLTSKTSLRVELSEENEHFHRIYWTDNINPLRTINLNENPEYYLNKSAEDLNVFKSSKLVAPEIASIINGGNVLCGSHSYAYRLTTTDGKTSRLSNITNPIQVKQTQSSENYHEQKGGSLETNSSNAVSLIINDIDSSYETIQVINIRHLSADGAIEAIIISESIINSTTFSYIHNGNETKVSISIGELLRSHVSWDTCADIAIKDNRLFAANLTNNAQSVPGDFRVKSYKYTAAQIAANTGTPTAHTGLNNPDIHGNDYRELSSSNTRYNFINKSYEERVVGAETENFDISVTGVRVTFATKKLDLSKIQYFNNAVAQNSATDSQIAETIHSTVPHYGFLDKNDNGTFNNYKDPLFASKYTGYQRGEIYRFGILFYDKQGNSTFVKPIGDVRMPENNEPYITLDASGNRITSGPGGVKYFKHAGNTSITLPNCVFTSSNQTITCASGVDVETIQEGFIFAHEGGFDGMVDSIDASTNSFTIHQNFTVNGTYTLNFCDITADVDGFALYPQFDIKLPQSTLDIIGGYSIVRVERKEIDKSVISAGVLNDTIIHANVDGNGTLRHKNGNFFGNIYGIENGNHQCVSKADFTYDTPESSLGKLNYNAKSGDSLYFSSVFNLGAQTLNTENDNFDINGISNQDSGIDSLMQHIAGSKTGKILSGRFNPNTTTNYDSLSHSNKVIYSCYDSALYRRNATAISKSRNIDYGQNVAPNADVSASRMGLDFWGTGRGNQSFTNRSRFQTVGKAIFCLPRYTTTKKFESGENNSSGDVTVQGVDTIWLTTGDDGTNTLALKSFEMVFGVSLNPFTLNKSTVTEGSNQKLVGHKLYTYIKRNVENIQYGGSAQSNFEQNQYIQTGHVNYNPTASNREVVFGGDTFINMYGLQKFKVHIGYSTSNDYPSTAIVFPVESSINIDLRDGVFFGSTDDVSPVAQDNFFINETYSCQNTSKTFLQKPENFKDVNNYPNLIAASNLKLAGNLFDAFTTFDANEIHELDNRKGPVYNLFSLRDELFSLQANGVSKLSINPRVVVDNADAAAVTVVTGTGQIIQRSDYIDTLYGSQHFNNAIVTNTSAYWFDANMSSFCKLVFGKGIAVQDLGITTQNTNIFNALKDLSIGDKPLDYNAGGIALYHNKILDEIGVCITSPYNLNITHMVYSELQDVMVTKKTEAVSLAFNLPGELLTIGRNKNSSVINSTKIYLENSNVNYTKYYDANNTNSLDVTFVCNESIYTTKKFDKLVLYLSGNENDQKFTTFTFTDSVSNTSFTCDASLSRTVNGKHIIPMTSTDGTSKATGQYCIIKIQSTNTGPIELFGALVHNRTTT